MDRVTANVSVVSVGGLWAFQQTVPQAAATYARPIIWALTSAAQAGPAAATCPDKVAEQLQLLMSPASCNRPLRCIPICECVTTFLTRASTSRYAKPIKMQIGDGYARRVQRLLIGNSGLGNTLAAVGFVCRMLAGLEFFSQN